MKHDFLKSLRFYALVVVVLCGAETAWGETYKLTIDASNFNTTSYAANNNEKTSNAVCTTDATKTYQVKWTSNQVMKSSNNMQWQNNKGYIYNSTDLGTITDVTITSSVGSFTTYYGTSVQPSSSTTVGGGYFQTKVGNATGTTSKIEVTFQISETPTCATPIFSPAAGTCIGTQEVTISCATEGATIYYTTDDTDPTTSSQQYSSAIIISNTTTTTTTTTIKAIAVHDDYGNSRIAQASYTIKPSISGYTVDFENDLDCYVDWVFTNAIKSNTDITAHGGSYFATTGGKATAVFQTKEKVAYPDVFRCYISKTSTNTTSSNWKVQVSSNGSNWTEVSTQSATSMTKGTWIEFTANIRESNITNKTNVYVRLYYTGSTATRTVDDICLTTYTPPLPTVNIGNLTHVTSIALDDENLNPLDDGANVTSGSTVYITPTLEEGYPYVTISVKQADNTDVQITQNTGNWSFIMPNSNVIISATASAEPPAKNVYELVTDANTLAARDIIIFAYGSGTNAVAMSITQNTNNRSEVSVVESNNQIEASSGIQEITLEGTTGAWYFNVGEGYLYAASSSSNWLRTQASKNDNSKATITLGTNSYATITFQGSYTHNLLKYNNDDNLFSCYENNSQKNVRIYRKTNTASFTLSQNCYDVVNNANIYYGTYSNASAFVVPEGLTVHTVSVANGVLAVTDYTSGAIVPANTGVMVSSATAGLKTVNLTTATATVNTEGNMLRPTGSGISANDMAEDGFKFYYLTMNGDQIGFYRRNDNGDAFNMQVANKAYLAVPSDQVVSIKDFSFNDIVDGIKAIETTETENNAIYNLAGQRVSKMQKGIYIVNGKKMLVK